MAYGAGWTCPVGQESPSHREAPAREAGTTVRRTMQIAPAPARATDPLLGLAPPGAMFAARDGRSVTRHYGSVATELAVCRKSVGMALRTELRVLEVAGREPWLERLLDSALRGHHPVPGEAAVVAAAGTWCARVSDRTALVAGPPGAVERWRRVAREAVIAGSPITASERTCAPISLIGPRAGRLMAAAGLAVPGDGGHVTTGTLAGAGTVVVRPSPDHLLLLVDCDGAAAAWAALLAEGRPLGLALVGSDAVSRLAAATRRVPTLL
jgi:glycine cleavage system aminomethyltransferase T